MLQAWPARKLRTVVAVLLVMAGVLPAPAAAQLAESDINTTHWAFSAFFGSGWYEISDNRSVFIFRIPPEHSLRQASWQDGQRQIGIELNFPLTLGLHNIRDLDAITEFENFGTWSFTPGIEVEIPVTERWWLRPSLHFGYGRESDSGQSAWLGYGGIKSRYRLDRREEGAEVYFLSALQFAGYRLTDSLAGAFDRDSVGSAALGGEFHHPLRNALPRLGKAQLNWHLTYSWLFDTARLVSLRSDVPQQVRDQWEVGIALAPRGGPIELGWFSFDQLGLAFSISSDGDYRAITFNFSSPFLR